MKQRTVLLISFILLLSSRLALSKYYDLERLEYFEPLIIIKNEKKENYMEWKNPKDVPEPLISLLQNPTEENAKIYLQWISIRQEQIAKAQEMIQKASHEQIKK